MEFDYLVQIAGDEPVFETGLLLAGKVDPNHVRRQLTRWTNAGRLIQLRRGLYALAPPYQKIKPHPFVVANRMVGGSYVSCQSALAQHGIIPEYVPTVVSACSSRPRKWETPLGSYLFRHIRRKYLFGYRLLDVGGNQAALVASPEKALLDLIHLTPRGDSREYLESLRLQNLDRLSLPTLKEMSAGFGKPKLNRAVEQIESLVHGWVSNEGGR